MLTIVSLKVEAVTAFVRLEKCFRNLAALPVTLEDLCTCFKGRELGKKEKWEKKTTIVLL